MNASKKPPAAGVTRALDGLLLLTPITPLHPGAGTAQGLIDNPVIRERATGYPFIQASSVKGVLRAEAEVFWKALAGKKTHDKTACLFGPERESATHHEGALVLNDARILAMPVRSFKGNFVWVTSRLALSRFFRDLGLAGVAINQTQQGQQTTWEGEAWLGNQALFADKDALLPTGSKGQLCIDNDLYLEEYQIACKEDAGLATLAVWLGGKFFPNTKYLRDKLATCLVLLKDDLFAYFIEHATQIEANIAIKQDTGTTVDGSLRYTEFLPSESLLYSGYRLSPRDRTPNGKLDPKQLFAELKSKVSHLQIGGDATVGKGFVMLSNLAVGSNGKEGGNG